MSNPQELLYARTHEWVRLEGDTATVGISLYAQEQLGEGRLYVGSNMVWPHLIENALRARVVYERDKE